MYQLRRCDGGMVLVLVAALCGTAAAGDPATEPQAFVLAATEAGLLEAEAARVAMNASTSPAVKSFADRMITDHGKLGAELAVIAKKKSITVPTQLDADRSRKLQWLRDRAAGEFDAAYAAQVVERYARTVQLFQANVGNADAELAAYAARALPLLEQHRRLAASLKEDPGRQQ